MSGERAKEKKPKGWYGKEAKAARAAAYRARLAASSAKREAVARERERASSARGKALGPVKAYAAARLARLDPQPIRPARGAELFRRLARREAKRVQRLLAADRETPATAGDPSGRLQPIEPTKERLAKGDPVEWVNPALIDSSEQQIGRTRRFSASHLDRLYRLGKLTWQQWYAGDWYRNTHAECSFALSVVGGYNVATSAGEISYGLPRTEAQLRARRKWMQARAVIGIELVAGLDRFLLEDEMARAINGQARARNVKRLALALDRLARWLGLPVDLPPAPRPAREREDGAATEVAVEAVALPDVDAAFTDDKGRLLPFSEISRIIRERLAEGVDDGSVS